ncbi:MAG: glycosyltransferase family 39 protein [Candidatus Hydrogenedentes bacterium]|nr:glycosyltransferase family 39 protein [Candidatus Hydrogenedentota bacterium]
MRGETGESAAPSAPARITPVQIVSLVLLLAIALGLRLYKIETESVWFDECVTYLALEKHLPPMEFFRAEAYYDPATVPVYFGSAYVWYNLGFTSIVGMRALSIIAGMTTIVVMYAFGRRLFGHMGGMTVALCMTAAKLQIYMSQEIRNYTFTLMFAAIAMYALQEAVSTNRRHWWVINVIANGLLCLTHFVAGLLLFAQGVYLVVVHWRRYKTIAIWAASHAPFLAFIPLWIKIVTSDNMEEQTNWIVWAGLDRAFRAYFFVFAGSLQDAMDFVRTLPIGIPVHYILGVLFMLAGAVFLIYCARNWRQHRDTAQGYTFSSVALLLVWLFVPPATLFIVARLVRPIFIERYVLFSSLALFLILGGAVASLPRKGLQYSAFGLLALVYAGNLVDYPRPLRHDFKSSCAILRTEFAPGDHLHTCLDYPEPPIGFYAGVPPEAIVSDADFPGVESGDEDFAKRAVDEAQHGKRAWVWMFDVPKVWEHEKIEAHMTAGGVRFTKWEFNGRWHTFLYRLDPA